MIEPIEVLLADDHTLVREMLREHFEREGLLVAAIASSGDETVIAGTELQPDVAVLDIDMPGMSAFEAARAIKEASPHTRVLFLSGFIHDAYVEQALAVEASGYLSKSERPERVAAAVRALHRGSTAFSPEVLDRIVVESNGLRLKDGRRTRLESLTMREREVLGYVARGMSQKQIARLMRISLKTVQHHITHVMDKLEIHDRVELSRFAIREGLV